jgi:hypothetical protein
MCYLPGCGSKSVRLPVPQKQTEALDKSSALGKSAQYEKLRESLGDRCYPGDLFPKEFSSDAQYSFPHLMNEGTTAPSGRYDSGSKPFSSIPLQLASYWGLAFQTSRTPKRRRISSVDDLALLSDISIAWFEKGELTIVGPPAKDGDGLRPDDWYAAFRAMAGTEAPGVSIDPGPDERVMTVRYFGGVQETDLGRTFFEADRTLKLMSTGFDNLTCSVWTARPRHIATELDLMGAELTQRSSTRHGGWHRFWFEFTDDPFEGDDSHVEIPRDRLVVRDESIPPSEPANRSDRLFAEAISTKFLALTEGIPVFRELQQSAALVALAKWMRDKSIPADAEWVKGMPARKVTPNTTPSITVLRTALTDRLFLRYGIHGGVDFQKQLKYVAPPERLFQICRAADTANASHANKWQFSTNGESFQAIRLAIKNPTSLRSRWVAWTTTTARIPIQPQVLSQVVSSSELVISNSTRALLTFQLDGPTSKTAAVPSGSPVTIPVLPGSYQLSVSSHCGSKKEALTVVAGDTERLEYRCVEQFSTVALPPRPRADVEGLIIINNSTGARLTVSVAGMDYTVETGSASIRLAPGKYAALITATCGTTTETFNIRRRREVTETYSCEFGTVAAANRPRTDLGVFTVNNCTGAAVTVSVGGMVYTVQPGSGDIRLGAGDYTAAITAICGTTTEKLNITRGSKYTGIYSCGRSVVYKE